MAEIGTIARPYAQAAFDVAKTEGNLSGWAAFLENAAQLVGQEDIRQLAQNPKVAKSQLVSLFEEVLKPSSDSHKNFLSTVVMQGRVAALPAICEAFLNHKNADAARFAAGGPKPSAANDCAVHKAFGQSILPANRSQIG